MASSSQVPEALQAYFESSGDKPSRLAHRIGRPASTVSRVLSGKRQLSIEVARDIEAGTDGKLKAEELLKLQFGDILADLKSSALDAQTKAAPHAA